METFASMLPEARELFPLHYEEVALDKDTIKLAVREECYLKAESDGQLHVCTVRADGKLAGYFIAGVVPHFHYREAGLMAYTDVYYILPEFRKGGAGFRLIQCAERTLKARGVTKMYLSHKLKLDHSKLFKIMGFRASDIVYTKLL